MIEYLVILVCLRGACVIDTVPTPLAYHCGDLPQARIEEFIRETHGPGWQYTDYECNWTRYA